MAHSPASEPGDAEPSAAHSHIGGVHQAGESLQCLPDVPGVPTLLATSTDAAKDTVAGEGAGAAPPLASGNHGKAEEAQRLAAKTGRIDLATTVHG